MKRLLSRQAPARSRLGRIRPGRANSRNPRRHRPARIDHDCEADRRNSRSRRPRTSGILPGGMTQPGPRGFDCIDAAAPSTRGGNLVTAERRREWGPLMGRHHPIANNVAPERVHGLAPRPLAALSTIDRRRLLFRTAPSDARQARSSRGLAMSAALRISRSPTPTRLRKGCRRPSARPSTAQADDRHQRRARDGKGTIPPRSRT